MCSRSYTMVPQCMILFMSYSHFIWYKMTYYVMFCQSYRLKIDTPFFSTCYSHFIRYKMTYKCVTRAGYRRSDIASLCKNASDWTARDKETGDCLGLCPILVQCCFAMDSQSLCSKILDNIVFLKVF
jgi:hypothetical protein